jgi:hypothetical protein
MINLSKWTSDYVVDGNMDKVEGWLEYGAATLTLLIDDIQKKNNICGGVAEIGVHHGKYFILLASLLRNDELGLALDVFEDQHLNIDSSGKGDRKIFEDNLKTHLPDTSRIRVLQSDSLAFPPKSVSEMIGGVRLFSVDGCHSKEHTVNDVLLAKAVLVKGGVIVVDDILNCDWPGVYEGILSILQNPANTLTPFFIGENKLVLCENKYRNFYETALLDAFESADADEGIRHELAGFDVISSFLPLPAPKYITLRLVYRSGLGSVKSGLLPMSGFSSPEPWGWWTDGGGGGEMSFQLESSINSDNCLLKIYGHAYIPKIIRKSQVVSFYLNGNLIDKIEISRDNSKEFFEIVVPSNFFAIKHNVLEIRAMYPTSPKSEGISDDGRLLGFALRGIAVFEL